MWILIFGLVYLIQLTSAQLAPIYDVSSYFYVGEGKVINTSPKLAVDFTFQVPTTFTISTAVHRIPFHAVTSSSNLAFYSNKQMPFWTLIESVTATSFFFRIYYLKVTLGTDYSSFGFQLTSSIMFRYMLVQNSFPDKYICYQFQQTAVPFNIAAAGFTTFQFKTTSVVNPAPLNLSAIDTVFIYSFPYADVNSTKAVADDSFQLNFVFKVVSTTDFSVELHAKYPLTLAEFQIKLFIYNKTDFAAMYVKIDYTKLTYTNLIASSSLSQIYTASYLAPSSQIMFGICGFEFSKYTNVGFTFQIDVTSGSTSHTIRLNNLFATSGIPQLELVVVLVSQFRCPNYEKFISSTLLICYNTSCPTGNYNSLQQVGITGIQICQPCNLTCGECSIAPNNCTVCYPIQNRQISGSSCLPLPHYFESGTYTASTCDVSCYQCIGIATNCTSCNIGSYLLLNACVRCSTYDVNCVQCSSTACTACNTTIGYFLAVNGSCLTCQSYDAQCSTCNTSQCLTCNVNYFISAGKCSPCSTYHTSCTNCDSSSCLQCVPGFFLSGGTCLTCASAFNSQCLQCTSTACTVCNTVTGYFLVANGSCINCQSYDTQCFTCNTTQCITCNANYFISVDKCLPCSTYHSSCTNCNSITCIECGLGFFLSVGTCQTCASAFTSQCVQCNSTACTACNTTTGYFLAVNGSCLNCQSYDPQCSTCNTSQCLTCNVNYFISAGKCSPCSTYHTSCTNCDSSSCLQCVPGFFLSAGTCQTCTSGFTSQCIQCTSSACTVCNTTTGYFLAVNGSCLSCQSYDTQCSTCNTSQCLSCNVNYFISISGICSSCSTYNSQCVSCNTTQCISCQSGYQLNKTSLVCQPVVCGDGIWIDSTEACDDGNLNNGDGCDSQCQVQTDYVCLIADKLPSGASFCKYNKNISVDFKYLTKQDKSNTVHLFFDLSPSNFKQLDQNTIKSLLGPIEIVDQNTGEVTVLPPESMSYSFHQNQQTNQVELVINYGQRNLQNSYLRFSVSPNNTNISSISHLPPTKDMYLRLSAGSGSVYLYSYGQDTYESQEIIEILAMVLGLLSLVMLFLGFCIPMGKLIVLECLAVVQIGFFSVLQFDKILPTFIGFRKLIVSSGYNDQHISLNSQTHKEIDVYKLMGLAENVIPNYNISFIVLFIAPVSVGLIGWLITRSKGMGTLKVAPDEAISDVRTLQTPMKQKLQNTSQAINQSLCNIIFQRVLFQMTFYGLLVCSYLAWISIIYSLKDTETIGFASAGIILGCWILLGYLFIKSQHKTVNLTQYLRNNPLNRKKLKQDHLISTKFGQFSQVPLQITSASSNPESFLLKKIYLVLILQRLLSSLLIQFVHFDMSIASVLLIVTFSVFMAGLIVIRKKCLQGNQSPSVFSYLQGNYVLRQSINFLIIILIETCYLIVGIICKTSGTQNTFVDNGAVIKGIPLIILSLLFLNVGFNLFLWIWELKSSKIIEKSKIIYSILFSKTLQLSIDNMKIENSFGQQDDEVGNMLKDFIQTSPVFKCRNSPFLGMQQKNSKTPKLLTMIKVQNTAESINKDNLTKEVINQLWQQI